MKAALTLLAALMLVHPAHAGKRPRLQSLTGAALVIDGDTIMLSLTKIRLLGVDAFEPDQPCFRPDGREWACGAAAHVAMTELVTDKPVTCDLNGRFSYGRPLAHCRINPGQPGTTGDIAAWMVSQGLAVVDPRFEQTYLPQQAEAKAAKRGAWAGTFQLPCQFRGSC